MPSTLKSTVMIAALMGACSGSHAAGFVLESPDIRPGHRIDPRFEFNGFGCSGENRSPALRWHGAWPACSLVPLSCVRCSTWT